MRKEEVFDKLDFNEYIKEFTINKIEKNNR